MTLVGSLEMKTTNSNTDVHEELNVTPIQDYFGNAIKVKYLDRSPLG